MPIGHTGKIYAMTATATASDVQTVRLKIRRQDQPAGPEAAGAAGYWEEFDVPWRVHSNVISCLQAIAARPTTASGRAVTPVVWECNCLEEVCGSCMMLINGRVRPACSCLVHELVEAGTGTAARPITLEPMSKFPVVRDLLVDRGRLFQGLKRIKGWVPIDGTHDLGPGPREDQRQQDLRYALSRCMSCACCLEACPQFSLDNQFIGAAAIGQTLYFNTHPTGHELADDRLSAMEEPGGVSDCGNAQNCVKVCPKDVPLTEAIARIGRQTTVHALRKFFMGR